MQHKINISIITSLYWPSAFLYNFFKYVSKIVNLNECELILIHNDALAEDISLINQFKAKQLVEVVHVLVPREGLYSSWNRGVKIARGNLVAIWNVDDIRGPDSLLTQKKALIESAAVMCYGDYYSTNYYGKFKKDFYEYNENYSKLKNTANKAHVIGCFPMWKKEIHDHVGYFDEQFKLVGDWDFQMRVVRNYEMVKAKEILGFCLIDKPHRLSSNRHLQYKEQTVVWLRYKLYSNILIHYLPQINGFNIKKISNFNTFNLVSNTIPQRRFDLIKKIKSILLMPFIYSIWACKRVVGRINILFTLNSLETS